jgi:hypothetical protein
MAKAPKAPTPEINVAAISPEESDQNKAVLDMQRKVEEINGLIATARKAGYTVEPLLQNGGIFSVSIELPEGTEPIRG